MSAFEIVLVVYAVILAGAALGVVYRMIVGPTILDRAISSDSLVTLVVMGMALYAAQSEAIWAGPAMLALTGLAFIGTVTFARFVAREEPLQSRSGPHPAEPATGTSAHEAIHLGPRAAGQGSEELGSSIPDDGEDDPWGPGNTVPEPDTDDPHAAAGPTGPAGPADPADPAGSADEDGAEGHEDDGGHEEDSFGAGGDGESGRSRWPDEPARPAGPTQSDGPTHPDGPLHPDEPTEGAR